MSRARAAILRLLCRARGQPPAVIHIAPVQAWCPPGMHRISHDEARARGVVAPTVVIRWLGTLSAEWETMPPLVLRAMDDEVRALCMQPNWEQGMYAIFVRYWPGSPPPALQIFVEGEAPVR